MNALNVGLIGCGNIAETYLQLAPLFPSLNVIAVADQRADAAQARAAEFGLEACSADDLLARNDIDIIVNLTIPAAHFAVSQAILAAGKHVYSEKPLALSLDKALTLGQDAEARGLRLGAAPDTFLGGTAQQARALIDDGAIGKITAGTAHFMSPGMESWHPNPDFFFQPGGGPMLDMGPYYLAAMINLLGPIHRVTAMGSRGPGERVIGSGDRAGQTVPVQTPTTLHATLNFLSGAVVTLTTSWDVKAHGHNHIELYGTDGTLILPDPNFFGGALTLFDTSAKDVPSPPWNHPFHPPNVENMTRANYRAAGLADMAQSILAGTPHRCAPDLCIHVTEVMTAILASAERETFVTLQTTCARPAPLPPQAAAALIR